MFGLNLQKYLKSIYVFIRGRPFIWTKIHQDALEEFKNRLVKSPELHLLDNRSRFALFSDTSKTAAGSAMSQL